MKRLYLIPSKVLCIKPSNKDTLIYCSRKNLTKLLSDYGINVIGNGDYRFVELPEGWDVYDDDKERIYFINQDRRSIVSIIDRIIYI